MSEDEEEYDSINNNKNTQKDSRPFRPHPALLTGIWKIPLKSNNNENEPEPTFPYKRRNPRRRRDEIRVIE